MKTKLLILLSIFFVSVNAQRTINTLKMEEKLATFGGGCFWCTEAIFEELEGVKNVVSGYAGGTVINPAYREVTTGKTGHAEVVQITYDPEKVTYEELLDVFFKTHDPTTLNRQGADVGTQYRSVIFYHSPEQQEAAEYKIKSLTASGRFDSPIVTQLEKYEHFYIAEDYHQDYFRNNPDQAYCSYVIQPKLKKMRKDFSDKIKEIK
jgi:peptide-methionine (S)-S-oxide reductase